MRSFLLQICGSMGPLGRPLRPGEIKIIENNLFTNFVEDFDSLKSILKIKNQGSNDL